jgi:type I restriction enzyme S subunit
MRLHQGWKERKLHELALVDSGQGAPQGEKWYNGEEIFVKAGDLNFLTDGKYVGQYCKKISCQAIIKYKLKKYKKNSIVFPKSGMSIKTNNIALLKYDSYVVNHLAIVEVKNDEEMLAKYLYYLLKAKEPSKLSLNEGYPSIRITDLKELAVVIPPYDQLPNIVSTLEKAELVKEWQCQSDKLTGEFLNSTFLKMFGDPKKNTYNWVITKMQDLMIGSPQNGLYKPSSFYTTKGTPILRIDSFYEGKIEHLHSLKRIECSKDEIERYRLHPNDIVINRVNSMEYLGKCGLVEELYEPTVYESNMMRVKVDTSLVNPVYLTKLLCSKFIYTQILKRAKKAVNQASINQKDVNSLEILLPPLELQSKFANIVHQVEKIKNYQYSLKELESNFFSLILQQIFEGDGKLVRY